MWVQTSSGAPIPLRCWKALPWLKGYSMAYVGREGTSGQWTLVKGVSSSQGPELPKCSLCRSTASWRRGQNWPCKVEGQGSPAWGKRVERGRRLPSCHMLAEIVRGITLLRKENRGRHTCPHCCWVMFWISQWRMSLEIVPLFTGPIVFKSHLICMRGLLFFPSHWLVVLCIQIPELFKTRCNPLLRWRFQSYK